MMLLALPLICSATVLVLAGLRVRPIIAACTMPFIVAGFWALT